MRAVAGAVVVLLAAWCTDASAYRPFDGTDAEVADLHEWEFEMQTVGYYRAGRSQYFDPGGVINYGLIPYDLDLFGGVILELPSSKYVVRPVAELFVEHDFGGVQTYSGLVGAIWQVSEQLALDVAVREASISGQNVAGLRAGFSLAVR